MCLTVSAHDFWDKINPLLLISSVAPFICTCLYPLAYPLHIKLGLSILSVQFDGIKYITTVQPSPLPSPERFHLPKLKLRIIKYLSVFKKPNFRS